VPKVNSNKYVRLQLKPSQNFYVSLYCSTRNDVHSVTLVFLQHINTY